MIRLAAMSSFAVHHSNCLECSAACRDRPRVVRFRNLYRLTIPPFYLELDRRALAADSKLGSLLVLDLSFA